MLLAAQQAVGAAAQQLAPIDPWYSSGGGRRATALTVSAVGAAKPPIRWAEREPYAQALEAMPGEIVLLSPACASYDMFRNFAERGNLFKEYVRWG